MVIGVYLAIKPFLYELHIGARQTLMRRAKGAANHVILLTGAAGSIALSWTAFIAAAFTGGGITVWFVTCAVLSQLIAVYWAWRYRHTVIGDFGSGE